MVTPRQLARASGLVGLTGGMLPLFLAHAAATKHTNALAFTSVRDLWVKRWAQALLRLFAVEVVIDGVLPSETREPGCGRLVVSNHRSALDIGVVLSTFGGLMVSRADLATWPLVGAAARAVGTIFVDRSSARSGATTLRVIQKHLGTGDVVHVFPEGTTFDGDEVRPFHGGAFVSAVRAQASVLPVAVCYPKSSEAAFVNESFSRHVGRLTRSEPTRMVLSVGTPFVARTSDRATDVTQRAHREVQALAERARQRCGP